MKLTVGSISGKLKDIKNVEITTIDELIDLMKTAGCNLIIGGDEENGYTVDLYDEWAE